MLVLMTYALVWVMETGSESEMLESIGPYVNLLHPTFQGSMGHRPSVTRSTKLG